MIGEAEDPVGRRRDGLRLGFLKDPASRGMRAVLSPRTSRFSFVDTAPYDFLLGRCTLRAALAQILRDRSPAGAEALLLVGRQEALPGHGSALLATLLAEAGANTVAWLEVPPTRLRAWLARLVDPLLRGTPLRDALASASRELELPTAEVFEADARAPDRREPRLPAPVPSAALQGREATRAFSYYPRLERVRAHVEANFAGPLTIRDAARVAHLEKKYFSSYFHAKVGVCFRDWLAGVRISHASEMIRRHDESITNVAFAVGFNDLRTFERAFKRHVRMTPAAYRRSARPGCTDRER